MQTIPNRLSYGAIVAFALFGCWDSVATPIYVPPEGGVDRTDAGDAPRDAATTSDGDVPDTRYCDPVAEADWPKPWADAEVALVGAINELRVSRQWCGGRDFDGGRFLRLLPELRCAARLHSHDLDVRESVNIDLKTPEERVIATGLRPRWFEDAIVTGGSSDYAQVLENLRESPEHCGKLFDHDFSAIGIGLYKEHWTLVFAGFGGGP